ncbi:MAG: 3-hydroxyacyl-CoA dehydrogenase NAD-binding domain-containing protein [Pseudomonadota bacterium]
MADAPPDMQQVAVVGGGLIGTSWASLFCASGYDVRVFDPSAEVRGQVKAMCTGQIKQLRALGFTGNGTLTVTDSLEEAAGHADLVQENAPEKPDLKAELFANLENITPADAIFASSTSSLTWTDMVGAMKQPGRLIIAHPFNPPHLLPLVEIYGEDETVVSKAWAFYESLERTPIRIRKPVAGHVANRLSSALFQEAVHMVLEGVATPEDIDTALKSGPGLRWAALGVFLGYHLGGGQGGIEHYLKHLGPSQAKRWAELGRPTLDAAASNTLAQAVLDMVGDAPIEALEAERDACLIAMQAQTS